MNYPTEEKPIGDIEILICDTCGLPTIPNYKDDIKTPFYKCEKGHTTSTPMKRKYCAEGRDLNLPVEDKKLQQSWGVGSRYSTDDEGHFNPNSFANYLTGQFFFKTEKRSGLIYIWNSNSGIYEPDGEIFIHEALVQRLMLEVKPHYQVDVEYFIRGSPDSTFQELVETPNLIAVNNGILNVIEQKFVEKSPSYFILSKLPVTYTPGAKCPAIMKFLTEVFGEQQLTALQDCLGYTLLKQHLFEIAFMLLGEGANGKSKFLGLLQTFLGRTNYSNRTLQSICTDRFAAADLFGKMANIAADLPSFALVTTGIFKTLTGGDVLSGQFKHKDAFQFQSLAKMWFSCNEFPQTRDNTDAYMRRWKVFNCPNKFVGVDADVHILDKITTETELSGFLNWCLEGLKRLLANGKFGFNETEEEMRQNIAKLSNPTKAFIDRYMKSSDDPKDYIAQSVLYSDFLRFCKADNLPSIQQTEFTKALKAEIPDVKVTKQRIIGTPTWVYQFIRKSVPTVPTTISTPRKKSNSIKISYVVGTLGTDQSKGQLPLNTEQPSKVIGESDVEGYSQLSCYFCQKAITDDDWVSDDFSENKPAHKKCYDDTKAQLKETS